MKKEKVQQEAKKISKRLQDFLHASQPSHVQHGEVLKNYGYELYRTNWKEPGLDYFFDYRQKRDSNIRFHTKVPISFMTFSRLLFPDSKLSTFEGKERFVHGFPCELEHLYRSLSFLPFFSKRERRETSQ